MNFMDQIIAYKLIKSAISPQFWLRALKSRVRRIAPIAPSAAEDFQHFIGALETKFKGRKVFTPEEYEHVRYATPIINALTTPIKMEPFRERLPIAMPDADFENVLKFLQQMRIGRGKSIDSLKAMVGLADQRLRELLK
ncbi:MAG: hypothetical protein QXI71_06910 [Candidatus Bathyarchaeia archaeon]